MKNLILARYTSFLRSQHSYMIAIGFCLGRLRLGSFQLGSGVGHLIALLLFAVGSRKDALRSEAPRLGWQTQSQPWCLPEYGLSSSS